jgi:hypothetical protein
MAFSTLRYDSQLGALTEGTLSLTHHVTLPRRRSTTRANFKRGLIGCLTNLTRLTHIFYNLPCTYIISILT